MAEVTAPSSELVFLKLDADNRHIAFQHQARPLQMHSCLLPIKTLP